ncbi:hypothetical protein BD309DRAFT_973530 [Dichomitus squalens]|uniref:Uncharacterized protein n=1 Tax=Dichomitus squalens TaxID=114155 RepID=A0A4Q9QBD0_9APHY|nr:uncharacterized protein DICSQDRAFT_132683 [Dichomitus squalens LYAD-421 SS1]EJF65153.1 hypothetical protein DICSQDRAFT_132683 [Dichomitus squalens LYAD-421 SS1]TBU37684.1 hypothetical protein BD309DRAFT_973530 [Dichomitus squalens]TBU64590.1 hypothetical protein BD310DRAFT_914922 [Dichomitus squalens]
MTKPQKQRPKTSSASLNTARQSAAKQAVKKRVKAPSRISKDQVADATAQINIQFAQVQALYAQPKQTRDAAPSVLEADVQDLAAVMKTL